MMMRGFANEGWLDRNLGASGCSRRSFSSTGPPTCGCRHLWIVWMPCAKSTVLPSVILKVSILHPAFNSAINTALMVTKSMMECQFSTAYCLSAYMLDQHPGPHWFSAEMLKNPTLLEMAGRVKMDTGKRPAAERMLCPLHGWDFPKITMKVTLKDSSVLEKRLSVS